MKKPLILLVVPALFFLGCKPKPAPTTPAGTTTPPAKPKACFTLNKTLIDSGETVSTTNCSTNAASYDWNFGLGLQSSSIATSPKFTYNDSLGFNPVRGDSYKVDLKAFNTSGSINDEKFSFVKIGYRQLDSVVVSNVPGFVPDGTTNLEVQFGPGAKATQYTSPPKAPAPTSGGPWSCTFQLDALGIKISANNKNEGAWSGRIINSSVTPAHTVTVFQYLASGQPIYFSKGVNVSPIVVKDHSNPPFELDFYYSIVAK